MSDNEINNNIFIVTNINLLIDAWLAMTVPITKVRQMTVSRNMYLIFTKFGKIMGINYKLIEKEFLHFFIYLKNRNS